MNLSFFDLNFVIYLSEMLNEGWIFAFKSDILMNSVVVVLTSSVLTVFEVKCNSS
jgi:hypothetical protein